MDSGGTPQSSTPNEIRFGARQRRNFADLLPLADSAPESPMANPPPPQMQKTPPTTFTPPTSAAIAMLGGSPEPRPRGSDGGSGSSDISFPGGSAVPDSFMINRQQRKKPSIFDMSSDQQDEFLRQYQLSTESLPELKPDATTSSNPSAAPPPPSPPSPPSPPPPPPAAAGAGTPQGDDAGIDSKSNSKIYNSSAHQQPGGNEKSSILSEIALQLRETRKQPGKENLFNKGGAAATALAAVASILGSAVLAAVLTPSEVVFTHLDQDIYRYNYCYLSDASIRDAVCGRLRVMYSLCCIITLIFDFLCLLATIIVAIGMHSWLTWAYLFFLLSILSQTLALIGVVWLAFPVPAAIGGSALLVMFLLGALVFSWPSIALAWHFTFGLKKNLVLNRSHPKKANPHNGAGAGAGAGAASSGESIGGRPNLKKLDRRLTMSNTSSTGDGHVVEGSTVLHWAAYHGGAVHRLLLSVLLAAGESVDIQAEGAEGVSPLMIAADRGNKTISQQLLVAGASVELTDLAHGRTALHFAAKMGNTVVVESLLKAGSDASLMDILGRTPQDLARLGGHTHVVEAIANFTKERLDAELLTAVKWKRGDQLRRLLDAGASPDSQDARGTAALTWAANRNYEEGVRCLLEAGADVDSANIHGKTPLIEAALAGNATIVKLLLRRGADANAALSSDEYQSDGDTALALAARRGHAEVVQALLTQVEVDKQAVDEAALNRNGAVLQILLKQVEINNSSCKTALQASALIGSEAAVKLFLDKGHLARDEQHEVTSLHIAAQEGHTGIVRILIAAGARVDCKDEDGRTALHWAAQEGYLEVSKELLLQGHAVVDCIDNDQQTPLHFAAESGKIAVAKVLLDNGANVNAVDSQRKTPLHLAAAKAHSRILEVMLPFGADLMSRDSTGMTALDGAREAGHFNLAALWTKIYDNTYRQRGDADGKGGEGAV